MYILKFKSEIISGESYRRVVIIQKTECMQAEKLSLEFFQLLYKYTKFESLKKPNYIQIMNG